LQIPSSRLFPYTMPPRERTWPHRPL
jgi:hypothetical protein